ncbi:MAG: hypothetical protein WC476_02240 [Phycisphaerae bacterium]|jgi:hypothetical protein
MIVKKNILKNLKTINKEYRHASTRPVHTELFAKLAILELCGWIEDGVDYMVLSYAKRYVRAQDNIKYFEETVKKVHNLGYENYRFLMTVLIGLPNFEYLERNIDPQILQNFKATMNYLKTSRDKLSHTYTVVVTRQIDGPSVTIQNFEKIYKGFKSFEKMLRTLKPVSRPQVNTARRVAK